MWQSICVCFQSKSTLSSSAPGESAWPSFHLWPPLLRALSSYLGLNQRSWEVVKVEYLQIATSYEMQNPVYQRFWKTAKAFRIVALKKSNCVTSDKLLYFSGTHLSSKKFTKSQISFQCQHFRNSADLSLLLFSLAGKRKISLKPYINQETRSNNHVCNHLPYFPDHKMHLGFRGGK